MTSIRGLKPKLNYVSQKRGFYRRNGTLHGLCTMNGNFNQTQYSVSPICFHTSISVACRVPKYSISKIGNQISSFSSNSNVSDQIDIYMLLGEIIQKSVNDSDTTHIALGITKYADQLRSMNVSHHERQEFMRQQVTKSPQLAIDLLNQMHTILSIQQKQTHNIVHSNKNIDMQEEDLIDLLHSVLCNSNLHWQQHNSLIDPISTISALRLLASRLHEYNRPGNKHNALISKKIIVNAQIHDTSKLLELITAVIDASATALHHSFLPLLRSQQSFRQTMLTIARAGDSGLNVKPIAQELTRLVGTLSPSASMPNSDIPSFEHSPAIDEIHLAKYKTQLNALHDIMWTSGFSLIDALLAADFVQPGTPFMNALYARCSLGQAAFVCFSYYSNFSVFTRRRKTSHRLYGYSLKTVSDASMFEPSGYSSIKRQWIGHWPKQLRSLQNRVLAATDVELQELRGSDLFNVCVSGSTAPPIIDSISLKAGIRIATLLYQQVERYFAYKMSEQPTTMDYPQPRINSDKLAIDSLFSNPYKTHQDTTHRPSSNTFTFQQTTRHPSEKSTSKAHKTNTQYTDHENSEAANLVYMLYRFKALAKPVWANRPISRFQDRDDDETSPWLLLNQAILKLNRAVADQFVMKKGHLNLRDLSTYRLCRLLRATSSTGLHFPRFYTLISMEFAHRIQEGQFCTPAAALEWRSHMQLTNETKRGFTKSKRDKSFQSNKLMEPSSDPVLVSFVLQDLAVQSALFKSPESVLKYVISPGLDYISTCFAFPLEQFSTQLEQAIQETNDLNCEEINTTRTFPPSAAFRELVESQCKLDFPLPAVIVKNLLAPVAAMLQVQPNYHARKQKTPFKLSPSPRIDETLWMVVHAQHSLLLRQISVDTIHPACISAYGQKIPLSVMEFDVFESLRIANSPPVAVHFLTKSGMTVDFAFPEAKIAIEVDGPFHFNPRIQPRIMPKMNDTYHTDNKSLTRLNSFSIFKQHILECAGWHVIRISVYDWLKLTTQDQKTRFLERQVLHVHHKKTQSSNHD